MLCKKPFISYGQAYGCGQCLPCRIRRRRLWTHRMLLEALDHSDSCFLTLTYSDENLPILGSKKRGISSNTSLPSHGNLNPRDLQLWLKRFRKAISPSKMRFYAVGEYGDESYRPHYHAAIFGYPRCSQGNTQTPLRRRPASSAPVGYDPGRPTCCAHCALVYDTWGLGRIFVGSLETHSAQYIAQYTTKKLTAPDDTRLKRGNQWLHPEFARMSRRPGIGSNMMANVAEVLLKLDLETSESDVPVTLRHGSDEYPLGRYLRQQLRMQLGKEPKASDAILQKLMETMRPLQLAGRSHSSGLKGAIMDQTAGKIARQEARSRIFKKQRTL